MKERFSGILYRGYRFRKTLPPLEAAELKEARYLSTAGGPTWGYTPDRRRTTPGMADSGPEIVPGFAISGNCAILVKMGPYEYPPADLQFGVYFKRQSPRWWQHTVRFPVALEGMDPGTETASGEYFQPRDASSAPLVVLLHGVGDASLVPCRWLARSLAARGIACVVPRQVVHSSRLPGAGWRRMPSLSEDEWFQSYRAAVVEVRQMVDWAGIRSELDGTRVAVLGISFGGFISAITMGVDERITAAVLIVSGGNSATIGQKARARVVRRGYRVSESEYQAAQEQYRRYLAELAENGLDGLDPPQRSYLTDPMTYAGYLAGRRLLMINARWDEFIPREATLDFWEACGRPEIAWLPANHTGIWLWYPLIRKKVGQFLESVFGL